MAVDKFQECFCGCGRKIKYCAPKELLPELDPILRQLEADQRLSALRRIEQLESRFPGQTTLLALKCRAALDLQNAEKLQEAAKQFVDKMPDNPDAHAYRSIAEVMLGHWELCMSFLQHALERIKATVSYPVWLAAQFACQFAAASGHGVTAVQLAQLLVVMSPTKETMALASKAMGLGIHLPAKYVLPTPPPPENVIWREAALAAVSDMGLGRWRKAATSLASLSRQHPREAWLKREVAINLTCLGGDDHKIAQQWREYAAVPGLPEHEAVQALAYAITYDEPPAADKIEILLQTREIQDADAWFEQLTACKNCVSVPVALEESADEPPPKAHFLVLDADSDVQVQEYRQAPLMLADALLYGKQTDRAARLEILGTREHLTAVEAMLAPLRPQDWPASGEDEVVDSLWKLTPNKRRYYRPEAPATDAKQVITWSHQEFFTEDFPEVRLESFGGLSVREAAADPRWRLHVQAMLLLEELAQSEIDLTPVREKLELPALVVPSPGAPGAPPEMHSLILAHLLDECSLSDDQLQKLLGAALSFHAMRAARKFVREIMRRPKDASWEGAPMVRAFAQAAPDRDALSYLDQVEQWLTDHDQPSGHTLIDRFLVAIQLNDSHEATATFQRLQQGHLKEEAVAERLQRILMAIQDLRDAQLPAGVPPVEAAPAAGESSQLWTPQANAPRGESKLWIPGQ